jgi:hypothetical protein
MSFRVILPLLLLSLPACASNELMEPNCLDGACDELASEDCLADQDLNEADVDISTCLSLPRYPESAFLGDTGTSVSLGAWELGQTAEGERYKYGQLSADDDGVVTLSYSGGSTEVDEINLECWAKGYYRLHAILQDPPQNYVALKEAGFQGSFFQFQTDLRNGSTGFRQISSYRDHLIKWVTVIDQDGVCDQPTLQEFVDYVDGELARRDISFEPVVEDPEAEPEEETPDPEPEPEDPENSDPENSDPEAP